MPSTATTQQNWSRQLDGKRQQDAVERVKERVTQQKEEEKKEFMSGAKKVLAGTITQEGSKKVLSAMWKYVAPSWGLSLLYLPVHYWLNFGWPEYVCKLGEEGFMGAAPKVPGVQWGAYFLDLIIVWAIQGLIALIIILQVVIWGFIGWVLTEPAEAVRAMGFGEIWEFINGLF